MMVLIILSCVVVAVLMLGVAIYVVKKYLDAKKMPGRVLKEQGAVGLLSPYLKYFSGSMTCLCDIVKNPSDLFMADVVFGNIAQIISARKDAELEKWYSQFSKDRNSWDSSLYKSKAEVLLEIFMACGISQQNDVKEFIWNAESADKYNKVSRLQIGEECKVVAPYWVYNGTVFEKGLVSAK